MLLHPQPACGIRGWVLPARFTPRLPVENAQDLACSGAVVNDSVAQAIRL